MNNATLQPQRHHRLWIPRLWPWSDVIQVLENALCMICCCPESFSSPVEADTVTRSVHFQSKHTEALVLAFVLADRAGKGKTVFGGNSRSSHPAMREKRGNLQYGNGGNAAFCELAHGRLGEQPHSPIIHVLPTGQQSQAGRQQSFIPFFRSSTRFQRLR